jgi:hypothetical protein
VPDCKFNWCKFDDGVVEEEIKTSTLINLGGNKIICLTIKIVTLCMDVKLVSSC